MAYRAKYYAALKPKLLAWHEQCPEDNLDELRILFSDFAKKKIAPAMLFKVLGIQREVLEHAPRPDGHVISFEQVSKLFVTGVQQTDTIEELETILDRHIARIKESSERQVPAGRQGDQPQGRNDGHLGAEGGNDEQHPAHTSPPVFLEQRPRAESISRASVSSFDPDERRTESREEAAKRRAVERQQEWCRYSLLVASGLDGDNVGNATVRAICSNLAQPSDFVRRNTLDELEVQLNSQSLRLDPDSEEKLLASVLELLFERDKHIRRRAMGVLAGVAPKGDSRVIKILCPTRGVCLGLSDEDDVVRAHAAQTLGAVAMQGDETVISALLHRVRPGTSANPWLDEDQSPDVRYQAISALAKVAQVGNARVQEAMLALLQRPRLRRGARSPLRKDFEDMDLDEEERLCASLALEALQDMGVNHAHASDSLIRYRAIRTLEKVAEPPMACGARAGGGGGGAVGAEHGLGAVEEALLRVMDSHEDDRLVFFAAFSVLCTRLGVVASTTCLYPEGGLIASSTRGRRRAPEGHGDVGSHGVDASLESLEFRLLELEASGGGGEDPGQGEEERQFVVEVLQAWLDKHQAKKEMRAAPANGTYGGVAKERLLDLKMRVGSLQTQRV